MRDRLRAVECPKDIVDQIGGWASVSVGEAYGDGYPLEVQVQVDQNSLPPRPNKVN